MSKKLHKLNRDRLLVTGCEYLYDPRLSLADKGLLTIILTLSDNDSISLSVLSTLSYEKKKVYEKSWKNLIKAGYLAETENDIIVSDYVSESIV